MRLTFFAAGMLLCSGALALGSGEARIPASTLSASPKKENASFNRQEKWWGGRIWLRTLDNR